MTEACSFLIRFLNKDQITEGNSKYHLKTQM